jgi:uncharacterized protein YndB with AHSA1/START domain
MAPAESRVQLSRRFAVPRERIFAAFASAGPVARWLTPSPDISMKVLSYDFRERGTYRFEYHAPDGQVMRVHGMFLEVVPPARIVFSWIIEPPDEHAGVDSTVRVSIEAASGGAWLTIEHERLDRPGAVERHAAGWAGALDQLASQEENRS